MTIYYILVNCGVGERRKGLFAAVVTFYVHFFTLTLFFVNCNGFVSKLGNLTICTPIVVLNYRNPIKIVLRYNIVMEIIELSMSRTHLEFYEYLRLSFCGSK